MSTRPGTAGGTPLRVLLIAGAAAVMVAAVLYLGRRLPPPAGGPPRPAAGRIVPPGAPIAAEADVFRTRPEDLAVDPAGEPRTTAHPRTLATYRRLRAYPGAPPRIPHGISAEEHRGTTCNTCHERGGYVPRFASYAPVSPHPEYASCQQCHLADAGVVGTPRPDGSPNALCLQCHAPGEAVPALSATEWRPGGWPGPGQRAMAGSPPSIPHGPELRGNCLACHTGPGAVEEIRTTHPERANCRQCHLPVTAGPPAFTRPAADPGAGGGR